MQGRAQMVIIRSKTFHLEEHVQPKIGNKFYGLRDGRLAFLNENEIVYFNVITLTVKNQQLNKNYESNTHHTPRNLC